VKNTLLVFSFLFYFMLQSPAHACTNFLVTKGASTDNATMISYAADSHTLYGFLQFIPAAKHLPGAVRDIYEWDTGKLLGQISEALETFTVVGNINEHQVAIGETTFGGREELRDPTAILDYGSLMFIALQRAKTAREAIQIMTDLVSKHGYYSEGESFSVSDPNEAWILDLIGKGPGNTGAVWVARKIPDGMVSAHANQPRIRQFPLNDPGNCLYARDAISFAREKGYFQGSDADFSFADAYAPLTFEALRLCESRVWSMFRRVAPSLNLSLDYVMGIEGAKPMPLWIKPDRKLSVHDVMELMRDHFEGSPMDLSKGVGAGPFHLPYRWRPLTWEVDGVKYLNERSTSTQQTGFSFVTQSRATLPDPIGGVFWFGVDDTASTVYVPVYCGILKAPHPYAADVGSFHSFSWESAFWVFNWVANFSYTRYSDIIQDIRKVQRELEGGFLANQPEIEAQAVKHFRDAPQKARQFLTDYSSMQAELTINRWRKLGEALLVKYIDGNVKDELGNVTHPNYPEEWYRRILKENPEQFKIKPLKGEPPPFQPVAVTGYFHTREELGPLGENVPKDFNFATEKLLLVPGTALCNQKPSCCLSTEVTDGGKKLLVKFPEAKKDKCGAPAWLVRLQKNDNRPILQPKQEH
jgi:dipeptidase